MTGWLKRYLFLAFVAGLLLAVLAPAVLQVTPALADDDGGDGGDDGDGDGGGDDGGDDGGSGDGGNGGDAGDGNGGPDGHENADEDYDDDHYEAYERRTRGELSAFAGILQKIRKRYDARILDVKLTRRNGRLFYEVKILDKTGHVREISVKATRSVRTNFNTRRQIRD